MHPIHSIMGNVLGMSVSTAVVICHTLVTVSVTGSNLLRKNVIAVASLINLSLQAKMDRVDWRAWFLP